MNSVFSMSYTLAENKYFKFFIIAVILLAGLVVGVQTYEPTSKTVQNMSSMLDIVDKIILGIFTFEVVVKILAEGKKPWRYFQDAWNVFDFLIVFVCYLAFFLPNIDAGFVAILRLARILRVFKLVTALPKLQLLVNALLKSIPSMFYVSVLLFLLFYIYAAMGVFMFGANDPVHFQTLHKGILSLFRVITLEDWTDIMYINMYGCNNEIWGYSEAMGCTNPSAKHVVSPVFFVSFVLIGTMIVLNLFIGVIMSAMEEASAESKLLEQQEAKKLAGDDDNENNENNVNHDLASENAQLIGLIKQMNQRLESLENKLDKFNQPDKT